MMNTPSDGEEEEEGIAEEAKMKRGEEDEYDEDDVEEQEESQINGEIVCFVVSCVFVRLCETVSLFLRF